MLSAYASCSSLNFYVYFSMLHQISKIGAMPITFDSLAPRAAISQLKNWAWSRWFWSSTMDSSSTKAWHAWNLCILSCCATQPSLSRFIDQYLSISELAKALLLARHLILTTKSDMEMLAFMRTARPYTYFMLVLEDRKGSHDRWTCSWRANTDGYDTLLTTI